MAFSSSQDEDGSPSGNNIDASSTSLPPGPGGLTSSDLPPPPLSLQAPSLIPLLPFSIFLLAYNPSPPSQHHRAITLFERQASIRLVQSSGALPLPLPTLKFKLTIQEARRRIDLITCAVFFSELATNTKSVRLSSTQREGLEPMLEWIPVVLREAAMLEARKRLEARGKRLIEEGMVGERVSEGGVMVDMGEFVGFVEALKVDGMGDYVQGPLSTFAYLDVPLFDGWTTMGNNDDDATDSESTTHSSSPYHPTLLFSQPTNPNTHLVPPSSPPDLPTSSSSSYHSSTTSYHSFTKEILSSAAKDRRNGRFPFEVDASAGSLPPSPPRTLSVDSSPGEGGVGRRRKEGDKAVVGKDKGKGRGRRE